MLRILAGASCARKPLCQLSGVLLDGLNLCAPAALFEDIQMDLAGQPISEAVARVLPTREAERRRDWPNA